MDNIVVEFDHLQLAQIQHTSANIGGLSIENPLLQHLYHVEPVDLLLLLSCNSEDNFTTLLLSVVSFEFHTVLEVLAGLPTSGVVHQLEVILVEVVSGCLPLLDVKLDVCCMNAFSA